MGKLIVSGGRQLKGELRVQGSKNAVLPVMAAAALCSGRVTLSNCPVISDRFSAGRILA